MTEYERRCEAAMEEARLRLSKGIAMGVTQAGDALYQPTEERLEELARLIFDGDK